MKKLLAIAVAAAITAPMAAMADTTVYGKAHVEAVKASGSSLKIKSNASRIGISGTNALDNGLKATHKFELGYDIASHSGGLSDRDAWVGLKGANFGEFRFGRHTVPSDLIDDPADFLTNGHNLNTAPSRQNNVVAYINKFGSSVGFAVAHIANGSDTGVDKTNDLTVNYTNGPIYAGLGYLKSKGIKANSRLALAYQGTNFGVGYVFEKQGSGKTNTISGKYSFGKAYIAGEYGKQNKAAGDGKSNILELGYDLGGQKDKVTKVYYEYNKETGSDAHKYHGIGLVHNF